MTMSTIFIAGSRNIKEIHPLVRERMDNIIQSRMKVAVGDADGADASVQEYIFENGGDATVYFCGSCPRNNIGNWPARRVETTGKPGTREFYTAKDRKMAEDSEYGLMIWDLESIGTLQNVVEMASSSKKVVVFLNKKATFINVGDFLDLERLTQMMSKSALEKVKKKTQILELIRCRNSQGDMFR